MIQTTDIHGNRITGTIIKHLDNTVIVEADGARYLVHKDTLGKHKRTKPSGISGRPERFSFDLEESQRTRKNPYSEMRKRGGY